ncbi:hypothetical protein BOX15_Mlig021892g1 [Macrostomum lignano]|uniref:CBM21 domain-containing protein n=1 Tax=Macrostomum lignano TaxID=282301 RepID=A0A267DQA9_9PLAT|nr:hypothetical protein BOX15_Mlig021892g1 [Macrostomum lignano]
MNDTVTRKSGTTRVNDGSTLPKEILAVCIDKSTPSHLRQISSGFYSMESGSDDGVCDSLSRAFREIGLKEVGTNRELSASDTAAQVDGWVQRSCDQTASEEETDVDPFEDDVTEAADTYQVEVLDEDDVTEAADTDQVEVLDEDEETWTSRVAVKRCSSLKSSCLTDSDSSRRTKKAVRFADSLGLDLIKVRHVFKFDAPTETEPTLRRLGRRRDSLAPASAGRSRRRLFVSPCFPQPGSCASFISRVMSQKIMLERESFDQSSCVLSGHIRVCNLHFEKRVTVRVTFDGWHNCSEVPAVYEASDTAADMTDRFAFRIPMPPGFGTGAGDRAALCVRYDTLGQTFWDSNYGENYTFDCLPLGWEDSDDESLASFS